MGLFAMVVETPWLNIDEEQPFVDEEGRESFVTVHITQGPGGRCTLLEHLFRSRGLKRLQELDAQQHEQIIPEPNITIWLCVVSKDVAVEIQEDPRFTVRLCEEVQDAWQPLSF